MAIIRFGDRPFFRNPWAEFEKIRRDMDLLARGLLTESSVQGEKSVYPALNITEDKEALYVRAEIPGVKPQALDISVEGETLTIKGERMPCFTNEDVSYHRREIDCGRFSRAVTLPTRVEVEKVVAKSTNGIFVITLPKAEKVKPRQVRVSL